jgi:hypothetical protein
MMPSQLSQQRNIESIVKFNFAWIQASAPQNRAMRIKLSFFAGALFATVSGVAAGPVELEPKEMAAPPTIAESEPWHFNIGLPGWLAFVSGDIGLHGHTSSVDVDFGKIISHVTGIASFSADVRKGRFGVYADILYLGLSDTVYPSGLLSSTNLDLSEYLVDSEIYYRVIEGPRGSLDLRAGARYTDLYNRLGLVGNGPAIEQGATDLVNAANADLRELLDRLLHGALDGKNPPLPVPPLGFEEKIRLLRLIREARQHPETARRRIIDVLNKQLNSSFSLTERWTDPYIGIGGRYNLTKTFYLTGKVDVGGFDVGSFFTSQGYAAFGCQVARNIYSELGFRYLYDHFKDDSNGFLWKTWTYGPQITAGINF